MTPKDSAQNGLTGRKRPERHRDSVDQRLITALGHPVRVRSLTILNERVASPSEIAKELKQTVGDVSYHIKVLKECECIELVDTVPRRGAMEHYYRATDRAFLDASEWASLSSVRPGVSAGLLQTVVDDALTALIGGTFDKRLDRHLSWTPMIVDEQGWNEIKDGLDAMLEKVLEIQSSSAKRLASDDATGVPVSVAMMGFEAAMPSDRKAAPSKKS